MNYHKMAKSMQMIEELDDCFAKTAANIMKYYGKIEVRNVMNSSNISFALFRISLGHF